MSNRLNNFLSRKTKTVQEKGFLSAVREIYNEHIFVRSNDLFLRHNLSDLVDYKIIQRASKNTSYDVKVISQLNQLEQLVASYPEKKSVFEKNIKDRAIGIAIFDGKNVLAYNWIAFSDYRDDYIYKYEFELDENEVYQFDLFVDPARRGAMVTPQILSALYNYCLSHGKKRILTMVAEDNTPSINLHTKLQFNEDHSFLRVNKLFFWRWSKLMTHDRSYRSPFARG